MVQDPLSEKSEILALDIIELYQYLVDKKEFVVSKQILRSGSSIGANIAESKGAVSKADFTNKLSIAYKEALETKYWLNLLHRSNYIEQERFESLFKKTDEIGAILFKSIKTKLICCSVDPMIRC